ncbi:MAG: zf-HC2 domain-containing protein [Armatimonadetes bacterium]|nr:zf-HC2 domain-containing protein [Armatimonadota bacterium]
MKCSQARDKLMDYIAAELPLREAKELSGHLDSCESCRKYLALAQKASEALNCLREEEPAPDVLSAVRQRIDAERIVRSRIRVPRLAAAFAVIFICAVIIAGWFLQGLFTHEATQITRQQEHFKAPTLTDNLTVQNVPDSIHDSANMSKPVVQQTEQNISKPQIRKVANALPVHKRRRTISTARKPILAHKPLGEANDRIAPEPSNGEPVMVFVLKPREPEVYTIQVSADAESDEAETPTTELNVVREFDVGGRVTSVTIAETVASANIY